MASFELLSLIMGEMMTNLRWKSPKSGSETSGDSILFEDVKDWKFSKRKVIITI